MHEIVNLGTHLQFLILSESVNNLYPSSKIYASQDLIFIMALSNPQIELSSLQTSFQMKSQIKPSFRDFQDLSTTFQISIKISDSNANSFSIDLEPIHPLGPQPILQWSSISNSMSRLFPVWEFQLTIPSRLSKPMHQTQVMVASSSKGLIPVPQNRQSVSIREYGPLLR